MLGGQNSRFTKCGENTLNNKENNHTFIAKFSYNYYKVIEFNVKMRNKNLKDDKHLLVSFYSKHSKIGHFRAIFSKK